MKLRNNSTTKEVVKHNCVFVSFIVLLLLYLISLRITLFQSGMSTALLFNRFLALERDYRR